MQLTQLVEVINRRWSEMLVEDVLDIKFQISQFLVPEQQSLIVVKIVTMFVLDDIVERCGERRFELLKACDRD